MTGSTRAQRISRRALLLCSAGAATTGLAGCASVTERRSADAMPPRGGALGINLHMERFDEPELMRQASQVGALGFRHVRGVVLPWSHIEAPRGHWKWEAVDRQVRAARAAGMEPLGCFGPSAAWASRSDPKRERQPWGWSNYPPDDVAAWSTYVEKVVARYRDIIRTWSPFNEPDNFDLYFPASSPAQARDPAFRHQRRASFLELQRATHEAARRADPGCRVLSGAFSVGGNVDHDFVPWLFENGYGDLCDALDVHAYWSVRNIRRTAIWARAILTRHGRHMPIWMTEIGAAVTRSGAPGGRPYTHEDVASFAPKALATALALGVERAYWYEGHTSWPRAQGYDDAANSAIVGDGPTPVAWSLGTIVRVLEGARSARPLRFAARTGRADGYVFRVPDGEVLIAWAASPTDLDNSRARSEGILTWAGGDVDIVLSERPTVLLSRS